jgi:hypothetical protein
MELSAPRVREGAREVAGVRDAFRVVDGAREAEVDATGEAEVEGKVDIVIVVVVR